jgi:hypothetical protein
MRIVLDNPGINRKKACAMPGRPFQSKLTPYFNHIKRWRAARFTWGEIVDKLGKIGVVTQPQSVQQFFKRHLANPAPLGFEAPPPPPRSAELDEPPRPAAEAQRPPGTEEWLDEAGNLIPAADPWAAIKVNNPKPKP